MLKYNREQILSIMVYMWFRLHSILYELLQTVVCRFVVFPFGLGRKDKTYGVSIHDTRHLQGENKHKEREYRFYFCSSFPIHSDAFNTKHNTIILLQVQEFPSTELIRYWLCKTFHIDFVKCNTTKSGQVKTKIEHIWKQKSKYK